jgi:ribosome-associated protein
MTKKDVNLILNSIAQTIYDKKGSNILALDVREFSSITDYVIIAEGNVDRHVVAIAAAIMDTLEKLGEKAVYVEGMQTGDWVVLDFIGVMVHLFMPGLRERYQLEQLWREGSIVDLQINVSEEPKISYSSHS